jgi:hypothetical protein
LIGSVLKEKEGVTLKKNLFRTSMGEYRDPSADEHHQMSPI